MLKILFNTTNGSLIKKKLNRWDSYRLLDFGQRGAESNGKKDTPHSPYSKNGTSQSYAV